MGPSPNSNNTQIQKQTEQSARLPELQLAAAILAKDRTATVEFVARYADRSMPMSGAGSSQEWISSMIKVFPQLSDKRADQIGSADISVARLVRENPCGTSWNAFANLLAKV